MKSSYLMLTKICLVCILSVLTVTSYAQETTNNLTPTQLAIEQLYAANQYKEALAQLRKAISPKQNNSWYYYKLACIFSKLEDKKNGFKYLNLAIEEGWDDLQAIRHDSDLAYLRVQKKWPKLLEKAKLNVSIYEATIPYPTLYRELVAMEEADQEARINTINVRKSKGIDSDEFKQQYLQLKAITRKHQVRMKAIIKNYGWPTISKVGLEGASAAWILVQHADDAPLFQQQCVKLLAKAWKNNEVNGSHYAYLLDKVNIAFGKKQVFGTQTHVNPLTGKSLYAPIQAESNIQNKRNEVGLRWSIVDYAQKLGFTYQPVSQTEAKEKVIQQTMEYEDLKKKITTLVPNENYKQAGIYYQRLLQLVGNIQPIDAFKAAINLSKLPNKEETTLNYLTLAVNMGWKDIEQLEKESLFFPLHKKETWQDLLARLTYPKSTTQH